MKITHTNGEILDTDNLPDVDAILMEESKKLHEQFVVCDTGCFDNLPILIAALICY